MGHRHRAALGDLLLEQRDNGTGRAQHIAKPDGAEALPRAGLPGLAGHGLNNQLRPAFGRTHYIGRPYRLVGRNQDKGIHPGLERRAGDAQGAEDVVTATFQDIFLDDRDMFVSRRVIHRLDIVLGQQRGHHPAITHRAQQRHHRAGRHVTQFTLGLIKGEFALLQDHQLARIERRNLAAKLAADRAAGAGHQDIALRYGLTQQLEIGRHHVAAKQVADIHLADPIDQIAASADLRHLGQDAHQDRMLFQHLDNLTAPGAGYRGQRDDHLAHRIMLDQIGQLFCRVDAQTVHVLALKHLIIVQEPGREDVAAFPQRRRNLPARLARAIDQGMMTAITPLHRQPHQPAGHEAHPGDRHRAEHPIQQDHRTRQHRMGIQIGQRRHRRPQHHRHRHGHQDHPQHMLAEIADHRPIQAHLPEDWQRHQGRDHHQGPLLSSRRKRALQANGIGRPNGKKQQPDIQQAQEKLFSRALQT